MCRPQHESSVPKGGSIGLASSQSTALTSLNYQPLTTSQSGEMRFHTKGLDPGGYIVRCYDGGGGMLGQAMTPLIVKKAD